MRALLALAAVALVACGLSIVGEPPLSIDAGAPPDTNAPPTSDPPSELDAGPLDATTPDSGPPAQVALTGVFDVDIVVNGPDGGPYDADGDPMDTSNNCYVTQTVALALGSDPQRKGLPDDARFPADANHAAVQLGWRNDDGGRNARRFTSSSRELVIELPPGPLRRLVIYGTSVQGNSDVDFYVRYTDGTESGRQITFNDWDNQSSGRGSFSLVSRMDRAKVDGTLDEDPRYSLWGGAVEVDAVKPLMNVLVHHNGNGPTKFYLLGIGLE